MDVIEPKSFVLEIKEYNKTVRQYNDIDYDRFMEVSKKMVDEHMLKNMKQGIDEVKNVQINFYTY